MHLTEFNTELVQHNNSLREFQLKRKFSVNIRTGQTRHLNIEILDSDSGSLGTYEGVEEWKIWLNGWFEVGSLGGTRNSTTATLITEIHERNFQSESRSYAAGVAICIFVPGRSS